MVGAVFKMHPSNVNKWRKRGCPRNEDGSYDLSAVIKWRMEDLALNRSIPENPEAQKWLTEFRKERAIMAKIERKEVEGDLINKEDMSREWGIRLGTLFSGIRLWSNRLSPRLDGKSRDEIMRILDEEIYILMKTFATTGRYCPDVDGPVELKD